MKSVVGWLVCLALLSFGCASNAPLEPTPITDTDDLDVGDRLEDDIRADRTGTRNALRCKYTSEEANRYEALPHPQITVSVQGLTARLYDETTGFEKVFPIGPGAIDPGQGSTRDESHTMWPVLNKHTGDFINRNNSTDRILCATYAKDSGPVFAGLPFIRISGPYALHGPIDNYDAPNGGNLRRGFVSHGCARMEAADIMELTSRIRNAAEVPIHVQREPERRADGSRVEVAQRWFGSECVVDDDCNFAGGVCIQNEFSGRGFCTQACTDSCPSLAPNPAAVCATHGDDGKICLPKVGGQNPDCRQFDHFIPTTVSGSTRACMPGTRGQIGDRCLVASDCKNNGRCENNICTVDCTSTCADTRAYPGTVCIDDVSLGQTASCARRCTRDSNASECPEGTVCEDTSPVTGGRVDVCMPPVIGSEATN